MEATLTKSLKIDKSNWIPVKFGDVVTEPRDTVKNITKEEIEHVVGLEHIETGNIHLRNSAGIEESTTFTKKFAKGDVLFGRRRAYLKKAAQASFGGICSGDITVLRAKKGLLPELLPFIVNNDKFFDYAIKHSAGGLSPRVKFKDLANYQFLLPPKDQQAQLAELLWAMDEVIEKERSLLGRLEKTYQILVDNLFAQNRIDWDYKPISMMGKINCNTLKASTSPEYEFKYLDIASIIEPKVIGEMKQIRFSDSPSRARRIVANNSIVISMVRPYQQSFAFVENGTDIIASTGTSVINVADGLNSKFVFHQFFSRRFVRFCEDRMTGTNYPAITPTDLEQFKIAIPKSQGIIEIETIKLEKLDKSKSLVRSSIASSKALQKSLINHIF
jgi:type I restriction enzyme S subunit